MFGPASEHQEGGLPLTDGDSTLAVLCLLKEQIRAARPHPALEGRVRLGSGRWSLAP